MDYYDEVAVLHGVHNALAIAVRDARQLADYLTLIRLVTAVAAIVDLVNVGIQPPADANPDFTQGWQAMFNAARQSCAGMFYSPREVVLMIAARQLLPYRAGLYIQKAKLLQSTLEQGFAVPESASDSYRSGWQKAYSALVTSDRFQLLVNCIADAVDVFGNGGRQQESLA